MSDRRRVAGARPATRGRGNRPVSGGRPSPAGVPPAR